ncbi:two-component system sensor histidine kinase CreC [Schlegelella sp. S2-27]|uniref:histidine kinase n=1 Tax=Caldimonas mangrovi TaxID=2944811 RepID=A0ABT0YTW7_9BURK|nr:two-component system sensor histidine kinase CreC [Caldimonas mangrovi]
MTKRNRIFIGILLVYALGVGVLMLRLLEDIDPRYRESAEESLVETAHLLATLVEQSEQDGTLDVAGLAPLFQSLYAKRFEADIYGFIKSRVELRVYVTDRHGRVLYDSTGRNENANFLHLRDVKLTLEGRYGARTTPDIAGNHRTAVMYVAAPIRLRNEIVGVVTVGKPVLSFGQFIEVARRKTLLVGLTSVAAVLLLAVILSVWLVRPLGLIADYVRYVRSQRGFNPLRLARRAAGMLAAAYDEMRDAIAGRNYVADYVQTLTHEVKSPLSAIRGASELLQEPMPEADRQRFLGNITRETQRIQELVDRMLELASLETRRRLDHVAPVALRPLVQEIAESAQGIAAPRQVAVVLDAALPDVTVEGDAFLLRRAVTNLVDNAIDFSSAGQTVRLGLTRHGRHVDVVVTDQGPGIPAYAEGRVFEKFYSLARPHSRKKSTGLGLAFVKEVAGLHDGRAALHNGPEQGAVATLSLPVAR